MMTNYYTAKLIVDERVKDALRRAEKDRLIRAINDSRRQQRQPATLIQRLKTALAGRGVEERRQALPTALEGKALECTS